MRRLSPIIGFTLLFCVYSIAQNSQPHGSDFKVNCAQCHSADSWQVKFDSVSFNHDSLFFPLEGRHAQIDCRSCHEDLSFKVESSECISCHLDVHESSLGTDCASCHTTDFWTITDIEGLHERAGFPLIGAHVMASCVDCHLSEKEVRFDPIGTECISCHRDDFNNAINPPHKDGGFSENCAECHNVDGSGWDSDDFNHDFFPLTLGHEIQECAQCHSSVNFNDLSSDCYSCHQNDYENTTLVDHQGFGLSIDCKKCHTTDPGWNPASFIEHDGLFFPIFSGGHDGKWNDCIECHTTPGTYKTFDCLVCHTNPETDDKHAMTGGYIYENQACLGCHPNGDTDNPFDHDNTNFKLLGAHAMTSCIDCHINGFENTPTACIACHQEDYDESDNPSHIALGISTDCATCHTTAPGWMPALFPDHDDHFPITGAHIPIANACNECHNGDYKNTPDNCIGCHQEDYNTTTNPNHTRLGLSDDCTICHTTEPGWAPALMDNHDDFYQLLGAHDIISSNCATCHNGDYNNTPNTCFGCHQENYDNTTNPDHRVGQFPTDCAQCHDENDWVPSTIDHDSKFPIYSGRHSGLWSACTDCHIQPSDYTINSCIVCHIQVEMDPPHTIVPGYIFRDEACLSCHPIGEIDRMFDHDETMFPLTGAHLTTDCLDCHASQFRGTSTECKDCHIDNFNGSQNPDHNRLNFSQECQSCHTTDPGWAPALLNNHDDYYVLEGAHAAIANECVDCHNGDYNNTPTSCKGCHQEDFDDTQSPDHLAAKFLADCNDCHSQDEWVPATWRLDHDALFFPITMGSHQDKWVECRDCHLNESNFAEFTCITCHINPETSQKHAMVFGFIYEDNACLACHPTGEKEEIFDHDNQTMFPLTGAHALTECILCHANGYAGTPTDCWSCHQQDYNQSDNPNHINLALSNDCVSCHSTEPGWSPALFENHDDYHVLNGAHNTIRTQCIDCHNGDYNNTPTTCYGCHQDDYDQTTNPSHSDAMFQQECLDCHGEDAWLPTTFDHDNEYFPIYSGTHDGAWMECIDCHNNPNNFAEFSCIDCHEHEKDDMDMKHTGVNGYSYNSVACFVCHPTGDKDDVFDHNSTDFELTGAHLLVACLDCHENGFKGTTKLCSECHIETFEMTTNPDHDQIGIPQNCELCHTTDPGWKPAEFPIHDDYYVLTGAHIPIANECELCHQGDYNNTPSECKGCHLDEYGNTTNPNHSAIGIPQNCDNCHTTDPGWKPATFDIHDNYYPLTGAHITIKDDCVLCHMGDYNNTPNTCQGCHMEDYNQTTNPNHSGLSIPTDCEMCHTTEPGWAPATFPIHDNYYPLTGAHANIANECAQCHMGDYNNTPTTCNGCHSDDYNQSTNPDHGSLGIPNDCEMCHTTNPDWMPATFPIHDNYYVLRGAHAIIKDQCVDCHNGDYNNTPNTCYGCHKDDYDQTTNPNHAGAGFPTDCIMCHSEDAWIPSTFDHDPLFPIYNGRHEEGKEWNQCIECHTTGVFTIFSCIDCHEHNDKAQVDDDHNGIGGYMYESNACFNCHPLGEK